jgi:hypothetical protein
MTTLREAIIELYREENFFDLLKSFLSPSAYLFPNDDIFEEGIVYYLRWLTVGAYGYNPDEIYNDHLELINTIRYHVVWKYDNTTLREEIIKEIGLITSDIDIETYNRIKSLEE